MSDDLFLEAPYCVCRPLGHARGDTAVPVLLRERPASYDEGLWIDLGPSRRCFGGQWHEAKGNQQTISGLRIARPRAGVHGPHDTRPAARETAMSVTIESNAIERSRLFLLLSRRICQRL